MTQDQALAMIVEALQKAVPSAENNIHLETHLVKDGIIDSLDSMAFLYELEALFGGRIEEITDEFDDFRVIRLVNILQEYQRPSI